MRKITDSVFMLECSAPSHSYLILGPEPVLVDTCIPGFASRMIKEMAEGGVKISDIKHILLTHHDVDHIGNAAALQQASGAQVWASAEDIPYITGEKIRHGHKRMIGFFLRAKLPTPLQAYPASNQVGALTVLPTPGHTPGHVCLLYRDVLFAGDLVAEKKGVLGPSPVSMAWNMPLLLESIQKIAPQPFKWVCMAHGMPVERGKQWETLVK